MFSLGVETVSTHFDAFDTSEGVVHVLTKTRWAIIIPMPHTSVMPHRGTQLARLGTMIKWTTKDPAVLATLHARVVDVVREVGISGMRDIADSARMSDRVAKTFGGTWQDVVRHAAEDGVPFPLPDDILPFIRGFT